MRNADDDPASCAPAAIPRSWSGRPPRSRAQEARAVGRGRPQAPGARGGQRAAGGLRGGAPSEEGRLAALIRAAADRREGLARLTGQVNSLRSRAEAADGRDRPADRRRASRPPSGPSRRAAGVHRAGDQGRRPRRRRARPGRRARGGGRDLADAGRAAGRAAAARSAAPRRSGPRWRRGSRRCSVGLNRKDGIRGAAGRHGAARRPAGIGGGAGQRRVRVRDGGRRRVRAAADAVAVTGLDAAVGAFDHLKAEDLGRAGLLLGGGTDPAADRRLADAARSARAMPIDVVEVADELAGAVQRAAAQGGRGRGSAGRAVAGRRRCRMSSRSPTTGTC